MKAPRVVKISLLRMQPSGMRRVTKRDQRRREVAAGVRLGRMRVRVVLSLWIVRATLACGLIP